MASIPVCDVTQFAKRSKANPSRIDRRTAFFAGFSGAMRTLFAAPIVALVFSMMNTASADDAVVDTSRVTNRTQSLASIRATAEQFVRDSAASLANENAKMFASAAELDGRLQLEACQGALNAFALNGAPIAARVTIGVRCDQGATWTVYVPVMVECEIDVLVLRNSMQRDTHVATSDLEVQHRRVPSFGAAYISDAASLRDQHLKRPLPAGTILLADMMARDLVVKRGQQVMLVYGSNGLVIQAPGLALADGGTADRIRVQNQTSLKVVEGVIESGNLVRVGM
jgi:flagella basal body P-ring formation protein FlgA